MERGNVVEDSAQQRSWSECVCLVKSKSGLGRRWTESDGGFGRERVNQEIVGLASGVVCCAKCDAVISLICVTCDVFGEAQVV